MFGQVDIQTPAGVCDAYVALPEGDRPHPAVLYYMDVLGLRPWIRTAVERIAAAGYYVLAPNLYYREGRAPVVDPAELLKPRNMPRLLALRRALTPEVVIDDAGVFLDFLQRRPETNGGDVAVIGYCMSGGMALRAASSYPDRIAAAASIHGSELASDTLDSPHHRLAEARAEIYVGLAEQDRLMPDDQIERLRDALKASGLAHRIETYPGTQHGFTLAGTPIYDRPQSERHWRNVLDLFERNLRRA